MHGPLAQLVARLDGIEEVTGSSPVWSTIKIFNFGFRFSIYMLEIVVATQNLVKIKAVETAFREMMPNIDIEIKGIYAESGVSDQPKTEEETARGAMNRAVNVSKLIQADYWIGIEGGIEDKNDEMQGFAWIVIINKDGQIGKGKTGVYYLPPKVRELIKHGKELGEADDIVFKQTNSKLKNGSIGILTDNVINRTKYYTDAVVYALIPFKNMNLYYK